MVTKEIPALKELKGLELALRLGGGVVLIGKSLGVSAQRVGMWRHVSIPENFRKQLSELTGVPEEDLIKQ
jgi:hypothetical protein